MQNKPNMSGFQWFLAALIAGLLMARAVAAQDQDGDGRPYPDADDPSAPTISQPPEPDPRPTNNGRTNCPDGRSAC